MYNFPSDHSFFELLHISNTSLTAVAFAIDIANTATYSFPCHCVQHESISKKNSTEIGERNVTSPEHGRSPSCRACGRFSKGWQRVIWRSQKHPASSWHWSGRQATGIRAIPSKVLIHSWKGHSPSSQAGSSSKKRKESFARSEYILQSIRQFKGRLSSSY